MYPYVWRGGEEKGARGGRKRRHTLTQLEQGVFRSHLIFRCWQRTQARTLGALPAAVEVEEGVGAPVEEDIVS